MMSAGGTPRVVLKMILNHVDRDITAVYDRYSYDAQKRKALIRWGEELKRVLAGKSRLNVVPFEAKEAV